MAADFCTVQIKSNVEPLKTFIELVKFRCNVINRRFDCPLDRKDIFRVEQTYESAAAPVLTLTFYPSDALLKLAAATFASEV